MKQRFLFVLTTLMVVSLLAVPASTTAQGRAPGRMNVNTDGITRSGSIDIDAIDVEAAAARAFRERLAARSGPVSVFVELDGVPVVETVGRARARGLSADAVTAEGQTQLARLERAQRTALSRIRAADSSAVALFQTQRVVNGIAMLVDAGKVAAIMGLPGVSRVSYLPARTLDNASSVPLIGAPQVWSGFSGVNGATGAGMRIGVIDTGIDYHHVNFGGPGGGYETNDTTIITDPPSQQFFGPNAPKVVGGFDFAGDDYDAGGDGAALIPAPDPDPMDCLDPLAETVGHGTHVAGTAAGFGTTAAGERYSGPYGTGTDFDALRIGPGVAPEAKLYALRVFGCTGSTNLTTAAIEWSVDPNQDGDLSDRLDVVNLSLGSDFGRPDDTDAIAANNASKAGVIVVFSAGNSSNTTYISGGPGSADYAITVASSNDGVDIVDAFRVNSPAGIAGEKPASFSVAYPWDTRPDVSGDLVYIPGNRFGCTSFSAADRALVNGKVLLVDWALPGGSFPCGSVARGTNAVAAGAIGIIMASGVPYFDTAITGSAVIPAVFTTFTVGAQLKSALGSGAVNVTFSNSLAQSQVFRAAELVDTLSDFSSRGPRGGDSALKPDIAAPGQSIFSTDFNSGNGGKSLNGTSMAAPHIAGVMALLRQLKPTLSVTELKALVMNTAVQDIFGFEAGFTPFQPVQRAGTGRVDVPRAAAGSVIAYDTLRPELVSVSFGNVEVVAATTITRTVTVKNFGAAARTYSVGYTPDATIPGVSYSVSPGSVSVPAGGTATISVAMRADPALMRHISEELVEPAQGGLPRHFIAEAAGTIDLYAQAPTAFYADVLGRNEVPPTSSSNYAFFELELNSGTGNYDYSITFSEPITLSIGSHLHRGAAGANGPVAVDLLGPGAYNAGQAYTGSVTLSEADKALLLAGNLYANFHTTAFPAGEIRGQVVAASTPDLRLGVYATARAASTMAVQPDAIGFGSAVTGTAELSFSGVGRSTGVNLPVDLLSVATLFELQQVSANTTGGTAAEADLSHIGVSSSFGAATPVVSSTLFFGLASHKNWSTPNTIEFNLYIDTDGSGVDDDGNGAEFIVFNWNLSSATGGSDANDVFVVLLYNVVADELDLVDFINVASAADVDTQLFNSNVMVLPVAAADLGLSAAQSRINYRVLSFSYYDGFVEDSGPLSYDLARPGVSFTSASGLPGTPAVADLPSTKVTVAYNKANYDANKSKGVLILHHHNITGKRVETVAINPKLYLPLVAKR